MYLCVILVLADRLGLYVDKVVSDRLKPYSVDKDVNKYLAKLFPMERFKMLPGMYRYNYKFLEIASDCVRPSDANKDS